VFSEHTHTGDSGAAVLDIFNKLKPRYKKKKKYNVHFTHPSPPLLHPLLLFKL